MTSIWVGAVSGVPKVSDFAITDGEGTPLIINTAADSLYYLKAGDVVTPCGGSGGGGGSWSTLTGRPVELTDGRVSAGLNTSGGIDFSAAFHTNKSLANVDSAAATKLAGIATGATKNTTTYSGTAPTSPTDGDIWADTTAMPYLIRLRDAGSWKIIGDYITNTTQLTDGANLGQTATWSNVSGAGKPADNATYNKAQGAWTSGVNYVVGDIVSISGSTYSCILAHLSSAGNTPPNGTYWTIFAAGGGGAAGTDAVTASISKENVSLQAYANGTVISFAPAAGQWSVFSGHTDVTASATYAATPTNCSGGVDASGAYSVTAMTAATAKLVMTATYLGVAYTKVFTVTQDVFGYEIVGSLPLTNLFDGRVIYLTADGKLYRYNGGASAWQTSVAAVDVTGQLADGQIAALAAAKITGTLSDSQLSAIAAAKVTGTLTDSQLSAIAATKVTGLLTDAQIAAIAASKVTGTLTNAQLAAIDAAKVTGTLTDVQLAAISASKITGQVTTTQITDNAITTAKINAGAVTSSSIAANTIIAANILGGTITATELAAGSVITSKIAANAVTTATLAAGAVTATELAAGAVTTAKLNANVITANEIASNAVTTGKINAGAVTTTQIAANTILAGNIAAATITGTQIAAATIASGNIVANTITAGNIAAGTITATELATGSITTAKIVAGAITTATLAAGAVTTSNIAAGNITTATIAAGAVTANEIAGGSITTAKLASTQLSALFATIGTMSSASAPNARVVISDTLISVYDSSNVLRVRLGIW